MPQDEIVNGPRNKYREGGPKSGAPPRICFGLNLIKKVILTFLGPGRRGSWGVHTTRREKTPDDQTRDGNRVSAKLYRRQGEPPRLSSAILGADTRTLGRPSSTLELYYGAGFTTRRAIRPRLGHRARRTCRLRLVTLDPPGPLSSIKGGPRPPTSKSQSVPSRPGGLRYETRTVAREEWHRSTPERRHVHVWGAEKEKSIPGSWVDYWRRLESMEESPRQRSCQCDPDPEVTYLIRPLNPHLSQVYRTSEVTQINSFHPPRR